MENCKFYWSALVYGMKCGFKYNVMNIKYKSKWYIIPFVLDIIFIPVKIPLIFIAMLIPSVRNQLTEVGLDVIEDVEQKEEFEEMGV